MSDGRRAIGKEQEVGARKSVSYREELLRRRGKERKKASIQAGPGYTKHPYTGQSSDKLIVRKIREEKEGPPCKAHGVPDLDRGNG